MSPEAEGVFAKACQEIEALPDSTRRETLQKSLIGMRLIIEILETLPPGDPFLDRCAAIALRIQASPPAEHVQEVLAELATCVEIARSKMM